MKERIKILKIIHLANCLTLIIAYVLLGNVTSIENFKLPNLNSESLIYLSILILLLFLSNLLFKSQLKKIDPKDTFEEKFPTYQNASIMRWALVEGAALLVLFLMPDFILVGILLIIYLIFLNPTEDKMATDSKDVNL